MKPCILMDIDGVYADFITPCLDAIYARTGQRFTADQIDSWDIMKSCGIDEKTGGEIYKAMEVPGLCMSIPAYPGAREGVDKLRVFADVVAITAPFGGDHWMHERDRWLVERMGFRLNDIMHVRSVQKFRVDAEAFVEDKTTTLQAWQEHWPSATGVLFTHKYNENDDWHGARARGWAELVSVLEGSLR